MTTVTKPFLKWVGGKTQILDSVLELFPKTIHNYYEPFLGGGSVLLGFLSLVKQKKIHLTGKIYASDLNSNLISVYKNIQSKPDEFISELKKIVDEFNSITGTVIHRKAKTKEEAMTSQESYYYWIRYKLNSLSTTEPMQVSAMFLFLNKTCFRGVYREGPHGFNVPFGHYKNPAIFDEEHIREVSSLLKDVIFTTSSFTDVLVKPSPGDFVYLDPPYAPETDTSFVGYTADGFSLDNHKNLFKVCNDLHTKKVGFLMSNADVPMVKTAFPSPPFTTKIISCRRAIHSKKPESKTNEVLISNESIHPTL